MMDDSVFKGPSIKQNKSESLIGVKVINIAILFGHTDELLKRVEFVLDSTAVTKILICDLSPGTWSILRDNKHISMAQATDEGRCIYLEGIPGSYCLELKIAR